MAYLDNNGVTYLWNKIKGLFNKGITNLSVSGKTITFTKGDGTTGTITTQDTNTTYGNFKGATASADGGSGLVPAPTKGNEGKYLKADGTWGTPANTTYADMKVQQVPQQVRMVWYLHRRQVNSHSIYGEMEPGIPLQIQPILMRHSRHTVL